MQSNWTAEHSQALREHLARGLSYSKIAAAINAKFNTAYSRNATIGRAKRMRIAVSDRPEALPNHLPAKQLPSHYPSPNAAVPPLGERRERKADFIWPMPVFEPVEMPKLRCVEVQPRHLSLDDLEPGDCRYPYGGEGDGEAITFCGHRQRGGSSYCAPHFHLTRGPGALYPRVIRAVALRLVKAA